LPSRLADIGESQGDFLVLWNLVKVLVAELRADEQCRQKGNLADGGHEMEMRVDVQPASANLRVDQIAQLTREVEEREDVGHGVEMEDSRRDKSRTSAYIFVQRR
jgi:hypothetical protein